MHLKKALAAPLPGLTAQLAMAPRYGPDRTFTPAVEASCLKAGVMLLLLSPSGRASYRADAPDLDRTPPQGPDRLPRGAIRGERGRPPGRSPRDKRGDRDRSGPHRYPGVPDASFIPPSNFCIYPVVGTAKGPLVFTPEQSEVAEDTRSPSRKSAGPRERPDGGLDAGRTDGGCPLLRVRPAQDLGRDGDGPGRIPGGAQSLINPPSLPFSKGGYL